ncbi:MAG: ABC transporter permease [Dehalococcoidia bacterium]|nr:ABC transporter permease [Dehalococcoidia bacterium]
MHRYVITRLLSGVLTLVLVSLIIFAVMRVLPGDVARIVLAGLSDNPASVPQEQIDALRKQLGLNDPLPKQYFDWVWGLVRLDWGTSLRFNTPVLEEITQRLPVTIELATFTMLIAILVAVPLGVISAIRQDTWIDYLARIISIGGLAMPTFWSGTLVILVLSIGFHWLPPLAYADLVQDPLTNAQQVIWPVLALAYYFTATVSRMTRSQMLEVLRQDYVRTAWAKGLPETLVVARHAIRNALLPVVTVVGLQYAVLLGGTVIMEQIFSVPGIGRALVQAISAKDFPLVQNIIVVFAAIIIVINLAVDILYGYIDPRVHLR